MSGSLGLAAVLTVLIGFVHSILGERRLIGPLLAPATRQGMLADSGYFRAILRISWHGISLAWWGFAGVFVVLAASPLTAQGRVVLMISAAMFFITGAVILVACRGRHKAWIAFFIITALTLAPVLV